MIFVNYIKNCVIKENNITRKETLSREAELSTLSSVVVELKDVVEKSLVVVEVELSPVVVEFTVPVVSEVLLDVAVVPVTEIPVVTVEVVAVVAVVAVDPVETGLAKALTFTQN